MLVRSWLGVGGSDIQGLLGAIRGLKKSATTIAWSDCVLLVDAAATEELLADLPGALQRPAPLGWPRDLPAGFHPLHLGDLHLLLCIGSVESSLNELVCQAHAAWVSGEALQQLHGIAGAPVLQRTLNRLARCCAQHATLDIQEAPNPSALKTSLKVAGFQPANANPNTWVYQPPWPAASGPEPEMQTCQAAVVGAGLAGAATALALVNRGWQVHLLDAQPAPAMGASGLPVGLMTEHQASSDTVLSALSRVGVPLHWRELAERIPQGQGWQSTTVANLKDVPPDQLPPLADLLTDPCHAAKLQGGALVRPSALIQSWLAAARQTGLLTESWDDPVQSVVRWTPAPGAQSGWKVQLTKGGSCETSHVVLASAYDTQALLTTHNQPNLLPLRPVKGQLTFGILTHAHTASLAPCPVRHKGVWVPEYADAGLPQKSIWAMGSTYERGQNSTECSSDGEAANLHSLKVLSAAAHQAATAHPFNNWAGVRCASPDRLPLAGQLPNLTQACKASDRLDQLAREPGLWTLCALGSRGLTLAALLGQWVAAQMSGAPWPLMRTHAMALDPARFALRHVRKQG